MLSRKNRLGKGDVAAVFAHGAFFSFHGISVKFLKNNTKDSRFAFVIGKKQYKEAVHRNYARRLMRAIIQENMGKIKDGLDVVVMLQSFQGDMKNSSLSKGVYQVFRQANMLK